jgi:hypothetical protein
LMKMEEGRDVVGLEKDRNIIGMQERMRKKERSKREVSSPFGVTY